MRLLRAKPVRANFVTAAFVTCAGDAIAQRIEWAQHADGHHPSPEPEREPICEPQRESNVRGADSDPEFEYNGKP